MRVLAQRVARGQQPSEKSPPAPSQTKASEKVLGGFFRTVVVPCYPLCPEPSLSMCVLCQKCVCERCARNACVCCARNARVCCARNASVCCARNASVCVVPEMSA